MAAVIGAGTTMVAALVSAPAQAASSITITHQVTKPGQLRHEINVHLPMNQEDAAGYIWNGAQIRVTCWGDDWADDVLSRVPEPGLSGPFVAYKGKPAPGQPGEIKVLVAAPDGVRLKIVNLYDRGTGNPLDEDILPSDDDEIYCKAKWIDGDGFILNDTSNTVTGDFS
ncbi:hypothetical protein [Herbidospora sp. RD11066]